MPSARRSLQEKAPDDLQACRDFVLDIAEAAGEAAGGGEQAEAATIGKIKSAPAT